MFNYLKKMNEASNYQQQNKKYGANYQEKKTRTQVKDSMMGDQTSGNRMRTGSTHQEQNQKEEASYNGYNKREGLMLQRQGSEERSNIYGQFKNARPT